MFHNVSKVHKTNLKAMKIGSHRESKELPAWLSSTVKTFVHLRLVGTSLCRFVLRLAIVVVVVVVD